MTIVRLWLLSALAALGACATATAQPAPTPSIYVVRHLNTPAGERDPDLLAEGRRSAALLAERLADKHIAAIYVTDYRRTRQTAAPLAARLGLTPIVYDPADNPGLIARVRAHEAPVLIVGHSNTVPAIVEALGGTRPPDLVHEDFGDIWRIDPDGATERTRIAPR
jgi:broad specificity phosphatase PhoE